MRLLYFILYFILPYSLKIYYPKTKILRRPKKSLNRTIYVCNHAASFMDPLVLAVQTRPIVFFMTRSDVFTPLMKPILWAAHMLPIYRQHDGVDTKNKNEEVFEECTKILKNGRNLLIYGEGFTDDVFVRRLKSLKKGAVRIGFSTLEAINWSKKIYIRTVGINYGHPNTIGSEVIISEGFCICLNDYKEDFFKAPNKVISELTHLIENDLQNQLTHVNEHDWAFFHEHVTRIKRMGIDPFDSDKSIPLLRRWENSKSFAKWINEQDLTDEKLLELKTALSHYFTSLKRKKISETSVYEHAENKQQKGLRWFILLLLSPLSILGLIHNYLPYKLIKGFVEKSFKRHVFWGSVKMMLGIVAIGIYNIPLVMLLHYFLVKPLCVGFEDKAWIISLIYYVITPLFGVAAYYSNRVYQKLKSHQSQGKKLTELAAERQHLVSKIDSLSYFN